MGDPPNSADISVSVTTKNSFWNKNESENARQSDVKRMYDITHTLEEAINRSLRLVNRRATSNTTAINDMAAGVNANLEVINNRIDTLSQKVSQLETNLDMNSTNNTLESANQTITDIQTQNTTKDTSDGETDQIYMINVLEKDGIMSTYRDESVVTFDSWAQKFKDLLDCAPATWDEATKLHRLKFHLEGTTRSIFDKLRPNEKDTVSNALSAIRSKLAAPHRLEISKRELMMCKQRNNETVREFMTRIVGSAKDLDELYAKAQEIEVLTATNESFSFDNSRGLANSINIIQSPKVPETNSNSWVRNPNQNNQYQSSTSNWPQRQYNSSQFNTQKRDNNYQRQPQNNWNQPQNNWNQSNFQRRNQFANWNTNDRRWSGRPVCQHCRKVGHSSYNCFRRNPPNTTQTWQINRNFTYPSRQNQNPNKIPLPINYVEQNHQSYSQEPQYIPQRQIYQAPGYPIIQQNPNPAHQNLNISELANQLAKQLSLTQTNKKDSVNTITEHQTKISKELENGHKEQLTNSNLKEMKPQNKALTPNVTNWEKTSMGPRLNHIFFIALILSVITGQGANSPFPKQPLICQTREHGLLWSLPEFPKCPEIKNQLTKPPIPQTRQIFVPNNLEYKTKAWACRKIIKTMVKYTSLSGVPIEKPGEIKPLEISPEECKSMVDHKKCEFGIFQQEGELFHTNNKLDLTPRTWLLGSFTWQEVISKNCYIFPTQVLSRFGEKSIQTPFGVTRNCPYDIGSCSLDDDTTIIWVPALEKNCEFLSISQQNGNLEMGRTSNVSGPNNAGKNII
uniref:Retrotransposon gag domain-containing protein n=1 Tax=Meloidogyne incognita TaxID=6306 RepID=A0A914LH92_MELIC